MKKFLITYKENKKYNPATRKQLVMVPNPTGKIEYDSKYALGIFIASTGTLKKNEIISIQELDENDKPVGSPIKPMADSAIVPTI